MDKALVPEIRFEGFAGSWKQRTLSETAQFNPAANLPNAFEYVDLESVVGTDMVRHRRESKESAPSRAQRLARTGDIFFQTVRPYQKNNYLYEIPDEDYVFSTGYAQMRPCINGSFLFCALQRDLFVNEVLSYCTGTSYPAINANDLAGISISIPLDESEQATIGRTIRDFDNLVSFYQRKYECLKRVKQAMLQKMFPKPGESTPELRFKNFDDPWELCKFSELALLRRGLTYSPADIRPYGQGVRVLRSSNIAEDKFILGKEDVFVDENVVSIALAQEGEILITAANGSPRLVGKRAIIHGLTEKTVHGGFMLCAHAEQPEFITALMGSSWYKHFLATGVAGGNGSIGNLDKTALENELAPVPTVEEQRQIGAFFASLDNLIALHQSKLNKLKQIKQAMLQKMFV